MAIAHGDLKRAFGQFPTGVAVVAARSGRTDLVGLTVSSFNSVSLDPPLVLFSVSKNAPCLNKLLDSPRYGVSVLNEAQEEVSRRFAGAVPDKWNCADYKIKDNGVPFILNSLVRLECEHFAVYPGGDHLIMVGRVIEIEFEAQEKPLVFFRGKYKRLSDDCALSSDRIPA